MPCQFSKSCEYELQSCEKASDDDCENCSAYKDAIIESLKKEIENLKSEIKQIKGQTEKDVSKIMIKSKCSECPNRNTDACKTCKNSNYEPKKKIKKFTN